MSCFFRVASPAEFEDLSAYGRFRAGPNSAEGKYLWNQIEHAQAFRDLLLANGWERECIILKVEVADHLADRFAQFAKIDGIGPASFAELADLESAVVTRVIE